MIVKGEQGYIDTEKKKGLIRSIVGFILVILIYTIGYKLYGTNKNYATVLAVLLILPTAQILAKLIVDLRYKSVEPYIDDFLKKTKYKYLVELIVIRKKKKFFIEAALISPESIYFLIKEDMNIINIDVIKQELEILFKKKKINIKVELYSDFTTYKSAISNIINIKNRNQFDSKFIMKTLLNTSM